MRTGSRVRGIQAARWNNNRALSRRDFLKASGMGLAGATLLGTAGCGGAGGGGGASGEGFTLLAGHNQTEDSPFQKGLERFADLLDERTGGQVTLDIRPNSTLGDAPEMFQGLQQGTQDVLVGPSGASLSQFVPVAEILNMPFAVTSWEQRDRIIHNDNGAGDQVAQRMEDETGIVTMGYMGGGRRSYFYSSPAESIKDIQGRSTRVTPSPVLQDTHSAVGVSPEPVDYSELYNALAQGVVDGADHEPIYILLESFYEPARHMLLSAHEVTIRPFMISPSVLDQMPEDLSEVVLKAGREASEYGSNAEREADEEALQTLQDEHNFTVTKPPDLNDAVAAAEPVWERYAEEWGAEDILQQIQEAR